LIELVITITVLTILTLGVMPLVFATGAGREGRWSVGTAVAGGMFFATFLNIIFIPVLYVFLSTLLARARKKHSAHRHEMPHHMA